MHQTELLPLALEGLADAVGDLLRQGADPATHVRRMAAIEVATAEDSDDDGDDAPRPSSLIEAAEAARRGRGPERGLTPRARPRSEAVLRGATTLASPC